MSVQVLVPAAMEPVNLAEAKVFLQLDSSHDDALVTDLIRAATEAVEQTTGRALITRTLRQTLKNWPDKGVIALAIRPLISISQIQQTNAAGVSVLVDPGDYYVDVNRARVIALPAFPRPSFVHPAEELQIDFVAGYGVDASFVPASFRMSVLLIVRDLYEHRGETGGALPLRAQALLAPFTDVRL